MNTSVTQYCMSNMPLCYDKPVRSCCLLVTCNKHSLCFFNLEGFFLPFPPTSCYIIHYYRVRTPLLRHVYCTHSTVRHSCDATAQTNQEKKNGMTSSDGQLIFLFFFPREELYAPRLKTHSRKTPSIIASTASTHHQKQRQADNKINL